LLPIPAWIGLTSTGPRPVALQRFGVSSRTPAQVTAVAPERRGSRCHPQRLSRAASTGRSIAASRGQRGRRGLCSCGRRSQRLSLIWEVALVGRPGPESAGSGVMAPACQTKGICGPCLRKRAAPMTQS
jgi:hypothetical protein